MMHSNFDVQTPVVLPDEIGTPMELTVRYFREMIRLYSIQDEILAAFYSVKKDISKTPEERVRQSVTDISFLSSKLHNWLEHIDPKRKLKFFAVYILDIFYSQIQS